MLTLTGSVGKNGSNAPADIKAVQKLLNRHAPVVGFDRISEDARFGAHTLKAIVAFQKAIGMRSPDGVVEPAGRTLKALASRPAAAAPKEEAPAEQPKKAGSAGKLVGNLTGVQADLVAYARAVAAFYGRDIKVSSGRRNNDEQAAVMFKYWTSNLERGRIYAFLRSNPATLERLDELYDQAEGGDADAKRKFLTICSALAPRLSAHVAGRAIDVSPKNCMTTAMRDALKQVMKEVEEKTCFHYEVRGTVPAPSQALQCKWDPA